MRSSIGGFLRTKIGPILLSLLVIGCVQNTTDISSGSYGPFEIGESKASALAKTEDIAGIRFVVPMPSHEIFLENPSSHELGQMDEDEAIQVFLDHHPWPLRIEFKSDVVSRTWGAATHCHASKERMNIACAEIRRLSTRIAPGLSRADTYKAIVGFHTPLSKQVRNTLARRDDPDQGRSMTDQEYRTFLLSKGGWRFDGLKELSRYKTPFYSEVTLYFKGDRLARIKHWSAPYELP